MSQFDAKDLSDIRNNQLLDGDRPIHEWFRFVLSFPPHLIRHYFDVLNVGEGAAVLDPFCGTGTTLVEAKKLGMRGFGLEAHPMAHFASTTKTTWSLDDRILSEELKKLGDRYQRLAGGERLGLSRDQRKVLLKDSISARPLHKLLSLLRAIDGVQDEKVKNLFRLILATTAVHDASNLSFGPEVGIGKEKKDADVWLSWSARVERACNDIKGVADKNALETTIWRSDSRSADALPPNQIDFVFTSPPYPNEKDYTRTTRLESVLLGFIRNKTELRSIKKQLMRSNTRNIYKGDTDEDLVKDNAQVNRLSDEIERRRIALGKDSGFERLYAKVTRMYFGGMKRHLMELKPKLRKGAKLCYVVGDQASFLQVHIETGELLADIAHEVGYTVAGVDVFRTRFSTVTKEDMREEVVILSCAPPPTTLNLGAMPSKHSKRSATAQDAVSHGKPKSYDQLITEVFKAGLTDDEKKSTFLRQDFEAAAKKLGITLPKNLGDILYSYRYRFPLPEEISKLLKKGEQWVIRSVGRAQYEFARSTTNWFTANPLSARIPIPNATPELVRECSQGDEQRILSTIRYNRLIDVFTGVASYSLQSRFKTTVKNVGQITTDELYVGVNKDGEKFCFPIQAKGRRESLSIVQVEQDFAMGREKFPQLKCRPIGVQLIAEDVIALLEFENNEGAMRLKDERHYRLVQKPKSSD